MKVKIILLPLVVFIMINAGAYTAYKENRKIQRETIHNNFIRETDKQYNAFFHEMKTKIDIARSMQAYFQASKSISRADFKTFASVVLKDRPEIMALNWLPKIPHVQRADFENGIQNEGFEQFTILDLTADKQLVKAINHDIYYPIKYYEPFEQNKKIHLVNALSSPEASLAISKVSNQNEYTVSQPLTLIQEQNTQNAVLIYFPVYKKQSRIGMVELVLIMKNVLNFSLYKLGLNHNVIVELTDVTEDTPLPLLVKHTNLNKQHAFYRKRVFSLGTRTWQMAFSPADKLIDNNIQGKATIISYIVQGPIISLMVSGLLLFLLIQSSKAERFAREYKASQSRFETLLEKSGDAISLLEPGVKVIDCNMALVTMLGFDSKDELIKHPADISPKFQPDGRLSVEKAQAMDAICLQEGRNQFEWQHQKKDGTIFWVDVVLTRLEYQGKTIIHVAARDISERKAYEAQLKVSEARLNQAQEIAHLGSWLLKVGPNQLSWSRETYYIFEIEPGKEVTFDDVIERTHPEDRKLIQQAYQLSISTKTPYTLDHRLLMQNGNIKFVRTWSTTEYDEINKTLISIGSVMDITEQKMHEQELLEARLEADQANKKKSAFLANISHELRTPMHGILGFSNFGIKKIDTASKEMLEKYFTNIQLSGNRLLLLINDLLDLSKLEAGKMLLDKKKTDLREVFELCCLEQEQRMKDLSLTVQLNNTSTPSLGVFDAARIGQVITNLLSNAIKFSPESGIIIVNILKTDNEELRFSIQDQGVGIPEFELEDVFDAFVQSSKTDLGVGGTGLGLAICQQIVAAHDGKIWAKNNVDCGAKFMFVIPCSLESKNT